MSAATLISGEITQGLRPVNLRSDLTGITDLIELCFSDTMDDAGRAALREMRMISQSPSLTLLFHGVDKLMGGLEQGFIWLDNGRIIGNVSVSPAHLPTSPGPAFIISNVAVHPDYRRQGLANLLMQAALDLIQQRGGSFVSLQVHADNDTARRLYQRLGFREERTFTRWRRPSFHRPPERLEQMPFMTLRGSNEWRAEFELAQRVRPNQRGGMSWLHPTTEQLFRPSLSKTILSWFTGHSEEHWITRRENGHGISGCIWLTLPLAEADRFDLLVDPAWQGKLEEPLLNYALRRLAVRRRTITTEHPTDDLFTNQILEKYDFDRGQTVINMSRVLA